MFNEYVFLIFFSVSFSMTLLIIILFFFRLTDDTDKNVAKCFCDEGWSGPSCTISGGGGAPPVSYPALGGTIVGGIALGVALVFGGVYARSYFSGDSFWDTLDFFNGGCGSFSFGGFSLPFLGGGSAPAKSGGYVSAPTEVSGYTAPTPDAPAPAPFDPYAAPTGSLNL